MTRKLASIQEITAINPIPNADRLQVASVLGWKVVVAKDEFKVGDKIVYIEIDSVLPIRLEFEFLRKGCYKKTELYEGFKIKTIRLRGQISQGLCLPLSILKIEHTTGDDVTEELGIIKHEPVIPACLKGEISGQFPKFLAKTDEVRIQAFPEILQRYVGEWFYATEKIDGASVTYYMKDGVFGVCSRNVELRETEGNAYWKFAREHHIHEKMAELGSDIAFQGELFGPGIQKNPLKQISIGVRFFNVFDISRYSYFSTDLAKEIIEGCGLSFVPIVGCGPLLYTVDQIVATSKGKSLINPDVQREGLVFRPIQEKIDLQIGRLSFKVINPDYLLEFDE